MSKSAKGIIAVIAVLGIGGAAYYYFYKKKSVSKDAMIKEIIANPAALVGDDNSFDAAYGKLNGFGADYIEAWYKALKANQPLFTLNGQTYHTGGGMVGASTTPPTTTATQGIVQGDYMGPAVQQPWYMSQV